MRMQSPVNGLEYGFGLIFSGSALLRAGQSRSRTG